jgi:5-methylthioribose kinase
LGRRALDLINAIGDDGVNRLHAHYVNQTPESCRTSVFPPMRELTSLNAADYLREAGHADHHTPIEVRELSGGVSNMVLRVEIDGKPPYVIKQCRERLRVPMEWRAPLERIWIELAAIELLATILPRGTVPGPLFHDRAELLFAMTCAPEDSVTWKTHLMSGQVDPAIATSLGTLLATIHAEAPRHAALRERFWDTRLFEELRIDPYYRTTARAHPELAEEFAALIADMERPEHERTLVLGDFSPKNILVHADGLVLLDFECAHAGDAAFDLGFFLSHLLLKAIHFSADARSTAQTFVDLTPPFWEAYLEKRRLGPAERSALVSRAIRHLGACLLARVDGKSPVEYLLPPEQALARSFACKILLNRPQSWEELTRQFESALDGASLWRR